MSRRATGPRPRWSSPACRCCWPLGAALGVVAAMVRDHRVAQSAADLAALAGAAALQRGDDGCAAAGSVAAANGARLAGCHTEGSDVVVRTVVDGPRWLGQPGDLEAEARAGPAFSRSAGRARAGRRAGRRRRACRAGGSGCRTSATGRTTGSRRRSSQRGSRRGWRVSQAARRVVAALGEAGAAGVAVVDEDREPAGVRVQGGGDAADVPAVAGREQRQQPDRAVLGGVRGAGQVAAGEPRLGERVVGHRPPDARWCAASARAGRAAPRRSPRRRAGGA